MIGRFVLALAFAIATQVVLTASPVLADPNTCIANAPNGTTLTVYDQPDLQSAVLGGIGVGQCDITVTNQCEGNWCVIVYQGLNGWVEMRYVSGSPVLPPAGASGQQQAGGPSRTFEILGGSGTVTMMGQTQPTPVDPGGTVTLTAIDDATASLTMPAAVFPSQPTMRRGAGDVWTGSFDEWAGIPANVTVTMRGVSTPSPVLVLEGDSVMATFRLEMQLRPVGGQPEPQQGGGQGVTPPLNPAQPSPPRQAGADSCAALEALSAQINALGNTDAIQELRGIYVLADLAFGGAQTPDKCQRALDLIAASPTLQPLLASGASGLAPAPTPSQALPARGPACREVMRIDRAVAFANDRDVTIIYATSITSVPIADVTTATEAECLALMELLRMEGLGSPDAVRLAANPTPAPVPAPSPSPVSPAVPNAGSGAQQAACSALSAAIRPVLRGGPADGRAAVLGVLQAYGIGDVASASDQTCAVVMAQLIAAAVIPDDGVGWGAAGGAGSAVVIGADTLSPLRPDPSDFVPDSAASQSQGGAPGASPTAVSGAACMTLGDWIVTVVTRGMNRELTVLADILTDTGIRSLSGETETACATALDATDAEGIGQ